MFENEGTEIENESGVESEVSPEPQSDAQPANGTAQEGLTAQAATKEPPFHEHPRWIERQNELNAERQARSQLEQRVAEMQRQFEESRKPQSSKPDFKEISAKMAERLKGIDPEFQSYMSALEEQALSASQQLSQFKEERLVESLLSKFDDLNSKNGVSPEIAGLYRAQLDQAYRNGQIRSTADMEKAYASVHEPMAKLFEAREKAALEKYTTQKKQDATKPASQPKGKPAAPGQNGKTFKDDASRKAAMVADIVKQSRASSDLG